MLGHVVSLSGVITGRAVLWGLIVGTNESRITRPGGTTPRRLAPRAARPAQLDLECSTLDYSSLSNAAREASLCQKCKYPTLWSSQIPCFLSLSFNHREGERLQTLAFPPGIVSRGLESGIPPRKRRCRVAFQHENTDSLARQTPGVRDQRGGLESRTS